MTEEWLQQNALWIIVDPWYPHPYLEDHKYHPQINVDLERTSEKILQYTSLLKYVVVSMSLKKNDIERKLNPKFSSLRNIESNEGYVHRFCKIKKIQDIVFCGFHYERCILNNSVGAKNMSKHYNVYVKKDLCAALKSDNPKILDEITKLYAIII